MTFRVGQKVVCVRGHVAPPASGGVIDGCVYTIRQIGLTVDGGPGLRVCELELTSGPGEYGRITRRAFKDAFMTVTRFRPIVERKTDISALKALLVPGAKIRERA